MSRKRCEYFDNLKAKVISEGSLSELFFNFYRDVFLYHDRFQKIYNKSISLNLSIKLNEQSAIESDLIDFSTEDVEYLKTALDDLLNIIQRHTGLQISSQLMNLVCPEDFFEKTLRFLLKRDFDGIHGLSMGLDIDRDKFIFILLNLYKPLIKNMRERSEESPKGDNRDKHFCPFCGFYPDMSALMESRDGARIIHCGLCEYEWEYGRMRCAVCGCSDHRKVGFLVSGDSGTRIDYCDECRGYIKTLIIPGTAGSGRYDLTIENLLTRDLDCSAMESGYARP